MAIYKKDQVGNFRPIKGIKDAKDAGIDNMGTFFVNEFMDGLEDLCKTDEEKNKDEPKEEVNELYPVGFRPYNDIWRHEPVTSSYFSKKMLGEAFTPLQQETVDIICGKSPFEFTDMKYEEVNAMWGKRSGKDSTLAKSALYQCYKLCCLFFPQEFIGMGVGSSIDIVNVASTSEQAKNVFFKYLSSFMKLTKDPNTNKNWFASKNFWWDVGRSTFRYSDLRDKDGDIKIKNIEFGRGITCHSLTSERFTAEGLNILLAFMDELGAMRLEKVFGTDERMVGQYDSLSATARSTSTNGYGKLVVMSYKYGKNCPMSILVKKNKKDKKKFVRVYSVYDVRTDTPESRLRSQFASQYARDPEKAAMMYECKDPKVETDSLYSNIYFINKAIDVEKKYTINPFKGEKIIVNNIYAGIDNLLEDWFKGSNDFFYTMHLDLAKGQVWKGHDAAAIALGHTQEMRLYLDDFIIGYYRQNFNQDLSGLQGQLRMGIVMDLVVQIICKRQDKEVNLKDIRDFAIGLQEKRGFELFKVTIDGWQSVETIQEFNRKGIEAELLSVDKTPAPHHTQKDFVHMGLFKIYDHFVWKRETKELIEVNNKIDHPELSTDRFEEEGNEKGSKDVVDCTAGVTFNLSNEISDGGNVFFG